MSTNKPTRVALMMLLAAFLLLGVTNGFVPSQQHVAHAASKAPLLTNGQQIEFVCPPQIDWLQIWGYNQNGDYVMFEDDEGTVSGVWYVSGWYWIGNVTIAYQAKGIDGGFHSYIQGAYIPKVWPGVGGYYTVDCTLGT